MIGEQSVLIEARRMAYDDLILLKSLKDWYRHKGRILRECQDYDFDEWLIWILGEMIREVKAEPPISLTEEMLVEALRVESIGDFVAVKASEVAKTYGFESDINCYVEEGVVHSSIWLKGDDAKRTEEHANRLAERFNHIGYSAETYIDEEDDREVTVNAQLDLPLYIKLTKMNMPECLLCDLCPKWYNSPQGNKDGGEESEEKAQEEEA